MSKKKKDQPGDQKEQKNGEHLYFDYYHKKGYTRDSYKKFHGKLVEWN